MPLQIFSISATIIDICLNINKYKKLEEFLQYACISPFLLTLLVEELETQPVFRNDFSNGES